MSRTEAENKKFLELRVRHGLTEREAELVEQRTEAGEDEEEVVRELVNGRVGAARERNHAADAEEELGKTGKSLAQKRQETADEQALAEAEEAAKREFEDRVRRDEEDAERRRREAIADQEVHDEPEFSVVGEQASGVVANEDAQPAKKRGR